MTRNTKKASRRIFYTAPRHWKIWRVFDWVFTPFGIVVFCLSAFLTLALKYAP